MGRYFTQQQKQVAVDKYFECKNSSIVVATLGYPSCGRRCTCSNQKGKKTLDVTTVGSQDMRETLPNTCLIEVKAVKEIALRTRKGSF